MKIIKYTMMILAGCLWVYSLYAQLGIALNILLGILFIFICFFEELLWKPIDLIGWTVAETETQAQSKIGSFNMGLEVQKSKISSPKLSPTEITSPNPNIMFNLRGELHRHD